MSLSKNSLVNMIALGLFLFSLSNENPTRAWDSLGGLIFGWAVCGKFNAKERSGVNVGVRSFYVLIQDNKIQREYRDEMADGYCQFLK